MRKRLLTPPRAAAFVEDWLSAFEIAAAGGASLVEAIEAVEEYCLSF